jgi:DNA-binding response OmpR family regulator
MRYLRDTKERSFTEMNPTILLVDDDDSFKRLIERALSNSQFKASLQYVWNGQEAISYLSRSEEFKDEMKYPWPCAVLLDLKMPRLNGFEVLEWRLARLDLKEMPFVVLTSSDLRQDKERALELGADHYFVKPMSLQELTAIIDALEALCVKPNPG